MPISWIWENPGESGIIPRFQFYRMIIAFFITSLSSLSVELVLNKNKKIHKTGGIWLISSSELNLWMSGKHVSEVLPEVYILTSNLKIVTASLKNCVLRLHIFFLKLKLHFYLNNLQSPHISGLLHFDSKTVRVWIQFSKSIHASICIFLGYIYL